MSNETRSRHVEHHYARTNRELFRPRESTGNPQYDFGTHYSRLSGLERLSLESHTVNGTQISRFEPDISHSTTCAGAPGFVDSALERARDLLCSAAFVSFLSTSTPAFATANSVRVSLSRFDVGLVGEAAELLSTDTTAPEYAQLVNRFAAGVNLRPPTVGIVNRIDHSQEVKIAAPEYAARRLGNTEDAAEFIRCLHLIAGRDASSLYLQQLVSHYYAEATRRPVGEVLKEMAMIGLEMAAVTATTEQLEFGGDELEDARTIFDSRSGSPFYVEEGTQGSPPDARALWTERAAQVLGEDEPVERPFDFELRAQSRLVYRTGARGFDYDEFSDHLSQVSAATEDDEEFGSYLDGFERVYEQYDEGFAVSLHMTDTERKIACGDLDEDTDDESLPGCARHLGEELCRLYTSGFPLHDRGAGDGGARGVTLTAMVRDAETRERVAVPVVVYSIDTWMDAAIDEAFGGRVARTVRRYMWLPDTKRTPLRVVRDSVVPRVVESETVKRGVTSRTKEIRHFVQRAAATLSRSRLHEQTETVDVCPNPEERSEAREVLEVLLQKLKRDYHTRGLNMSAVYRELTARLDESRDTAEVANLKREAWQHKEAGHLSFKLFTAFNTHAVARQAKLEAEPLCEERTYRIVRGEGFTMTQTIAQTPRKFILVQPVLNMIARLSGQGVADFARALHGLPRQEQERVRASFRERNPRLYARVRDGLRRELERASAQKLRYFRWALFPGNKPEHPVHTLTREDQSASWEFLKAHSESGTERTTVSVGVETSIPVVSARTSRPARQAATNKQRVVVVTRVAVANA
jgi:hypothetical protein